MDTPQTLKGFRDFLPEDAVKRKWLKNRLSSICELWGFAPLETPTLEPLELFAGQIGEDEKLFFTFKDQGNRDVALRYDQTVPTCRVIAQYQNQLKFPFKRYQIQPAFRAEKPQKGRYREFIQCDADIFGVKGPEADAEIIALSLDIYRQLGFKKAVVQVNSRKLLKDIPYEAIVSIDKLSKIGEEGVLQAMVNKNIPIEKAKEYFQFVKTLQPNDEIKYIFSYLKSYGFPIDWYEFNPTLARSFSYSDGPIWEVIIPDSTGGSVLGGERFDGLVQKLSGSDIGGTGFGLGFDRTLEAAIELNLVPDLKTNAYVLITVFNDLIPDNLLQFGKQMRAEGISCSFYTTSSAKLEKQLKFADQNNIPFVIIQGTNEVQKGIVLVKNMKTREQIELKPEDAIAMLKKAVATL